MMRNCGLMSPLHLGDDVYTFPGRLLSSSRDFLFSKTKDLKRGSWEKTVVHTRRCSRKAERNFRYQLIAIGKYLAGSVFHIRETVLICIGRRRKKMRNISLDDYVYRRREYDDDARDVGRRSFSFVAVNIVVEME